MAVGNGSMAVADAVHEQAAASATEDPESAGHEADLEGVTTEHEHGDGEEAAESQ